MIFLLPLLLIMIVLAIFAAVRLLLQRTERGTTGSSAPRLPFLKKDYLLSAAERTFFEVLCQVAGSGFHIFAKVRMEDLLYLPRGTLYQRGGRIKCGRSMLISSCAIVRRWGRCW
jgi:hypothetical protein